MAAVVGERRLLAVAHRAGNSVAGLRAALDAGVDFVEADVHRFRRALEVRHWKSLGPRLLWDGRTLARRRDLVLPDLAEVLAEGGARLMLDLKGVHPGLAPAVAALLREHAVVAVCTRHWWMLDAFAAAPHVRLIPSAGSSGQLRRLRVRLRAGRRPRAVFGVSVHRRLLTPAVVAELRSAAGHVLTWPVDHAGDLREARTLGVTGVISKSLPLLREVMDTPPP